MAFNNNNTGRPNYFAIKKINERFRALTRGMNNSRGTELHKWQCDLAYLQHAATAGPQYMFKKHVQDMEQYVNTVEANIKQSQK